jgi:hypothetical protein
MHLVAPSPIWRGSWGRGKEILSNLADGLGERQRNPLQFGGWVGGEAKNATSPNTNFFEMLRRQAFTLLNEKGFTFLKGETFKIKKVKPLNAGTKKSPTLRRGFQNYPS